MNQIMQEAGMPENVWGAPVEKCKGGIFVPVQKDATIWPPAESLARGTAFPCLYDPWQKGEIYCE